MTGAALSYEFNGTHPVLTGTHMLLKIIQDIRAVKGMRNLLAQRGKIRTARKASTSER